MWLHPEVHKIASCHRHAYTPACAPSLCLPSPSSLLFSLSVFSLYRFPSQVSDFRVATSLVTSSPSIIWSQTKRAFFCQELQKQSQKGLGWTQPDRLSWLPPLLFAYALFSDSHSQFSLCLPRLTLEFLYVQDLF